MPRNNELRILANDAMLTVVVGSDVLGRADADARRPHPASQPPNVRPGKDETLPVVRAAAAWKLGFPLQIPTVIERSSVIDSEVPYRVYKIDDDSKTVRFTFRTGRTSTGGSRRPTGTTRRRSRTRTSAR